MDEVAGRRRTARAGAGNAGLVFDTLRAEIIRLDLAPGTVLSRQLLQERFGLSSTPVRDALMRLEEEGLVEVFPQHATVVAPIDLERARRAQFLRRSLEIEVARSLAAAPPDGLVEALEVILRRQDAVAAIADQSAFADADESFHETLFRAAGVPGLRDLVKRESGHIDRLRRLHLPHEGKMAEILAAHRAIVGAIREGRPTAAERAMRDHLSRSLDYVETLAVSHPGFFRPSARHGAAERDGERGRRRGPGAGAPGAGS